MTHATRIVAVVAVLTALAVGAPVQAQTWHGLRVVPESRCSPYRASEYSYPQSIEARIVESLGGVWSPYTGRTFAGRGETDIEHMVARSEAHDSGLCAATTETRRRFAMDLLNLTLASPGVNRGQKNDRDAAAWLPDRNRCWFADRVLRVRQKYRLTIDRREANALDQVLASCASTSLVRGGAPVAARITPGGRSDELPAEVTQWDDNSNGRITCAEARKHGIAPVRRGHPAYRYMNDRDNDGTVCDRNLWTPPRSDLELDLRVFFKGIRRWIRQVWNEQSRIGEIARSS